MVDCPVQLLEVKTCGDRFGSVVKNCAPFCQLTEFFLGPDAFQGTRALISKCLEDNQRIWHIDSWGIALNRENPNHSFAGVYRDKHSGLGSAFCVSEHEGGIAVNRLVGCLDEAILGDGA